MSYSEKFQKLCKMQLENPDKCIIYPRYKKWIKIIDDTNKTSVWDESSSGHWQDLCREFVGQEVWVNQSYLVDELLKKGFISYDDLVYPQIYRFIDTNGDWQEGTQEEFDEMDNQFNIKFQQIEDEKERLLKNVDYDNYQDKIDEAIAEIEEQYDCEWSSLDELYSKYIYDYEEVYPEVFEWYVVSDFLQRKLKDLGEAFLETDYETWWGRQCTGQSILLDYNIQKIIFNDLTDIKEDEL